MGERYDPYAHARSLGLRITSRRLRGGRFAELHMPSRTIVLATELCQLERRCCVAHEVVHFEQGHGCRQDQAAELRVHTVAAHRLVTSEDVYRVVPWARDVRELADEWWTDDETARVRMATLTEVERQTLEETTAGTEGAA